MVEFACEVVTRAPPSAPTAHECSLGSPSRGYVHESTPGYTAADLDAVMPGPHWCPRCSSDGPPAPCTTGVSRQHMPYYLDEFTFRFNRRTSKARGMLFYRLLQQAVDTDPHPLKDLIGG